MEAWNHTTTGGGATEEREEEVADEENDDDNDGEEEEEQHDWSVDHWIDMGMKLYVLLLMHVFLTRSAGWQVCMYGPTICLMSMLHFHHLLSIYLSPRPT